MSETTSLRLDDQLCFALYSASATIVRAYRPMLEKIGLTYPQFLVMVVLWEDDDISVGTLAERLDLPANGLAPVLDRLVKAGLVERHRDPSDRRVHRMRLTAAGRDLEFDGSRIAGAVACRTRLSTDAITELRSSIQQLTNAMHDDSPLPGAEPAPLNGTGV
ncbi:MarR family winged helix-turn-helix transcriptional regulator [Williamsia deligens]|uniref:MarR family winged helix-turn-helix transcriptional regulator n=1 Tax=Williamsia deligens TaxID=321325 RepID=A0ABW3G4J9_9NOCA|nr:MarR family transcriptional regulator [Williamsia deligens]MCP2194282.1 DNA-binding transcriptional regulator, MarR family [Williamsia deligens]